MRRRLLFVYWVLTWTLLACSSNITVNKDAISPSPEDQQTCIQCHGSSGANVAPPKALNGATDTTFTGVGAHQSHLKEGAFRVALACSDCHLVPASVSSVGHIDSDRPAEVVFSDLASVAGFDPQWNGTTCTGIYCHGASIGGGSNPSPTWTKVDGTQATCGSCHSLPPPPPHTTNDNCVECHATVVDAAKNIINKSLHINGEVDTTLVGDYKCNSCHGSATNNAPPKDTSGKTATTDRGVGAHQAHVLPSATHAAFTCVQCHILPSSVDAVGHKDTALPAEITFGTLAKKGNLSPTWSGTSCAQSYCHGNFTGGLNASPNWTQVDGSQAKCGTCHAIPPSTGKHKKSDHTKKACSVCHGTGYTKTSVRAADHVNGVVNIGGLGSEIISYTNRRCTPTCHDPENW